MCYFGFLAQSLLEKEPILLNEDKEINTVLMICINFFYICVFVEHADLLGPCPEDEAISPGDECMDAVLDESLLETCPIQSPLQVFAGMGGLALIAERLPMLYPDVIQQVSGKK